MTQDKVWTVILNNRVYLGSLHPSKEGGKGVEHGYVWTDKQEDCVKFAFLHDAWKFVFDVFGADNYRVSVEQLKPTLNPNGFNPGNGGALREGAKLAA